MKQSYVTITDQFCGAGGSSIGATATGAELKLALNHWKLAIETHNSNFPNALHDCTDISACDPRRYPATDLLLTSPECTNHSLAKGKARKTQMQPDLFGKIKIDPAEERSRATMWDVPRFAEYHRYNIIIVENVVDARLWVMWDAWLHAMQLLGYEHKIVYFNSMFAHPTPQSRDRMYVVFWKKGNKAPDLEFQPTAYCAKCEQNVAAVQVWKKQGQRWGRYRKQYLYLCPACQTQVEPYYYCAANCIDWSIPAQRIGEREKPLKEKTLKRIQAGLDKFGRQPILADTIHSARNGRDGDMTWSTTVANRTQIGQATQGLIMPPMTVNLAYTHAQNNRCQPVTEPMPTQTSYQTMGLVVPPFIAEMYGQSTARAIEDPLGTVTGTQHHGLVVPPYIVNMMGNNLPTALEEPMQTILTGNHRYLVIPPFLASYYGTQNLSSIADAVPTVSTVDRHSLVVPPFIMSLNHSTDRLTSVYETVPTVMPHVMPSFVHPGNPPAVEDCGFRMLQPHEIKRAMAFPDEYVLLGNARERVKLLGNAVTPPVMQMLVERCIRSLG